MNDEGWPRVTVVVFTVDPPGYGRGANKVVHGVVTTGFHDRFRWRALDGYERYIFKADEGGCWIRGWPDPDSGEILALMAAVALAPPLSSLLLEPDVIPIGNLHDLIRST